MRLKLSQSIPWSEEETGGFAISAVLAAALFGFIAYLCGVPNPVVMGLGALLAILILNMSLIKKLPGLVQFILCCAGGVLVMREDFQHKGLLGPMLPAIFYGFVFFCLFRVNWWAWWDYPSRRTIGERIAASIFFTGIPFLGLGFGVWRLVFGIGLHDVTTQFVTDPAAPTGKPLETIIEDPALAEHASRMAAIRAGLSGRGAARAAAANKDAASGSI